MSDAGVHELVDDLFRRQAGRMTAGLVRVFGSAQVDLVEDVVQDALVAALRHWPFHGVPDAPEAWLIRAARNAAIDRLRRGRIERSVLAALGAWAERAISEQVSDALSEASLDEHLRLMFACADPALDERDQVCLMLKSLCGFGVREIARALLSTDSAIEQRLVRAKRRLRAGGLGAGGFSALEDAPALPTDDQLPDRLRVVLRAIYLMFNEGYLVHEGSSLIREDLIAEALRLGSLLTRCEATNHPDVDALLALMSFHAARLAARESAEGALLLMEDQDRSAWDQSLIQHGFHHLQRSMASSELTVWHLEAGIAAVHARSTTFAETNWAEILDLYDSLVELNDSPVIALNRAVALGMHTGMEQAIPIVEMLIQDERLKRYHLGYATLAEMLVRAGRAHEAVEWFDRALGCACSEPERRLLASRRRACEH